MAIRRKRTSIPGPRCPICGGNMIVGEFCDRCPDCALIYRAPIVSVPLAPKRKRTT